MPLLKHLRNHHGHTETTVSGGCPDDTPSIGQHQPPVCACIQYKCLSIVKRHNTLQPAHLVPDQVADLDDVRLHVILKDLHSLPGVVWRVIQYQTGRDASFWERIVLRGIIAMTGSCCRTTRDCGNSLVATQMLSVGNLPLSVTI